MNTFNIAFLAIHLLVLFFIGPIRPDEQKENSISYELCYAKTEKVLSTNQVLHHEFKPFPKSKSFGIKNGVYWIRLKINKPVLNQNLIAYIPTHNIKEVVVYKLTENKLDSIHSMGNAHSNSKNEFHYKFPYLPIPKLEANSTFYLKAHFEKQANFPLHVTYQDQFQEHVFKTSSLNNFFYGICIIIIIFNVILYTKAKNKINLYYIFFLSSILLKFHFFHGSFISSIGDISFYHYFEMIINCLIGISFLLFSIQYLNLNKHLPRVKSALFIFPLSLVFFYLLYELSNNSIFLLISEIMGATLFPLIWIIGCKLFRKAKFAKFYLLGHTLIVPLSIYLIAGYNTGFWQIKGDIVFGKIASTLDMLVFTIAIVYRVNYSQKSLQTNSSYQSNTTLTGQEEQALIEKSTNPYLKLLKHNIYSDKPLTMREIDIIECLANDLGNNDIATKLFISPSTVKTHIRNLYIKFEVKNKKELKQKILNLKY